MSRDAVANPLWGVRRFGPALSLLVPLRAVYDKKAAAIVDRHHAPCTEVSDRAIELCRRGSALTGQLWRALDVPAILLERGPHQEAPPDTLLMVRKGVQVVGLNRG